MQRALREPRPGLAVLAGAVLGLPGAVYLTALHRLDSGKWSTGERVVAVFLFAIIEFTLIIIPLILLTFRPAVGRAYLTSPKAAWAISSMPSTADGISACRGSLSMTTTTTVWPVLVVAR
jgi:hypothetical protein